MCDIEKLKAVPRKMNVSPCLALVLKHNLTTVGRNLMRSYRSERSLTWPFEIVVCMSLNIHRFAALIGVYAVRQLVTLK